MQKKTKQEFNYKRTRILTIFSFEKEKYAKENKKDLNYKPIWLVKASPTQRDGFARALRTELSSVL